MAAAVAAECNPFGVRGLVKRATPGLDQKNPDAGWSCPHCKNDGGPETVIEYVVEVEEAAPAPITVEAPDAVAR